MDFKNRVLQKNGITAIKLAREFMTCNIGDRISTVADYSSKFATARGTVQTALKLLQESRAITLEARGHQGTFIVDIDYVALWEFTDFGTIMGVMPLPYSKLYEGLATAIYKIMNDKNIPFSLAYMRGAANRVKALENGRYDFIVVSKLAALNSIKNNDNLSIALEFSPYSYVSEHTLVFSNPSYKTIETNMKIGIDIDSIDHSELTYYECKNKEVNFIKLSYNQIITKLMSGEIDAAVWNLDELIERKIPLKYVPLKASSLEEVATQAVILVNKNSYGINNLLSEFIKKEQVEIYQKSVVSGEIIPNY